MKITVICVYNNEEIYLSQLKKTLDHQNCEFELKAIDNRYKKFSSASAALNDAARNSKGDILIFAHQDIYLKNKNVIEEFANQINKTKVGDIVGTQGVREKSKKYYSNLTAGETIDKNENHYFENKLYEVSCVDEGMFGMKRETWINHNFDENVCDNWHLYCVEQCLYARSQEHKVYVYPSQIHHSSYGHISISYMKTLEHLCYIYKNDFKYIWTTCYKVRTNRVYIELLVSLWTLNRIIRRKSLN